MDWRQAREQLGAALYAPLRGAIARLPAERWPDHADLSALAEGIATARGQPLRFVPPREHTDRERRYYELHTAATGEVETRAASWHDLFNALVWVTFPRAKAAINAQHAAILEERGEAESRRRGPERDALTLFDEGGVIVASSAPRLLRLMVDFEWKELFWTRREELVATTRFLAFGHACYEQALRPYLGMVAKTVFLPVDESFAGLRLEDQLARADAMLARHFADRANFSSPRAMAPMPVLGVPGWHSGTGTESFYDDASHFRSKGARPMDPSTWPRSTT
jgi:hypothetical protein